MYIRVKLYVHTVRVLCTHGSSKIETYRLQSKIYYFHENSSKLYLYIHKIMFADSFQLRPHDSKFYTQIKFLFIRFEPYVHTV